MRETCLFIGLAFLCLFAMPAEGARVRIIAVDPFGQMLAGCSVARFYPPENRNLDFATRFSGLVAADVPIGRYYVALSCAQHMSASAQISVGRADNAVLVSSPVAISDYPPGRVPQTKIRVKGLAGPTKTRWIKLVGLYVDAADVIALATDNTASLVSPTPGKYWLGLFDGGTLLCHGIIGIQMELRDLITVDVSQGCSIELGKQGRGKQGRRAMAP